MFQLRRRVERVSSLLRKAGSVDDLKVPRMLPAMTQSPGKLTSATCTVHIHLYAAVES